jgi:hypothetical protein
MDGGKVDTDNISILDGHGTKSCAPFALPSEQYVIWKVITWEFDPRAMQ